MQVVEKVAGTFLLQEEEPIELLGALTVITCGSFEGWVLASFSRSGTSFSCEMNGEAVKLSVGLNAALRFAGTLLVLASVHISELQEDLSVDIGCFEISGRPGRKVVCWESLPGTAVVTPDCEGDAIEVRIHSRLAAALAFRIFRQVASIAQA